MISDSEDISNQKKSIIVESILSTDWKLILHDKTEIALKSAPTGTIKIIVKGQYLLLSLPAITGISISTMINASADNAEKEKVKKAFANLPFEWANTMNDDDLVVKNSGDKTTRFYFPL